MKKFSWLVAGLAMLGMVNTASAQRCNGGNCGQPCNICAPQVLDCGSCGSCCDTGCGCDSNCQRGGAYAEFGFMILRPYWKNNPAFFEVNSATNPSTLQQFDFGHGSQFVPKIAIGYVGASGVGARIGWWGFAISAVEQSRTGADSAGDVDIFSAIPLGQRVDTDEFDDDDFLYANSVLRLDVWDFEAIYTKKSCNISWLFSGGIRYAHMSQDYNVLNRDLDDDMLDPNNNDALISGHNFNGAGPTASVEVRRRVGNSGLALVAGARGSFLFGQSKQTATDSLDFQDDDVIDVATVTSDGVMPVGEVELGATFQRETRMGVVFAKASVVGQMWWEAGNSSRSGQVLTDDPFVGGGGASIDNNLGLFGVLLSAGLGF